MKKISLYITVMMAAFFFSCEETESPTVDPVNGQVALGFEDTSATISVPADGTTVSVNVLSATRSDQDRSIPVSIDESTSGPAADYQVGSVVIPAGEHFGVLDVTFNNFEGMNDCETLSLVLNLDSGSEGINGPQQFSFNYSREFECPDLFLNITFDDYPGETSWQVAQGETILLTGDNYTGDPLMENLCLCPGEYVFTIFDSFGDGICCNYGDGSYEVVYNGAQLFSGGAFGDSMEHTFIID